MRIQTTVVQCGIATFVFCCLISLAQADVREDTLTSKPRQSVEDGKTVNIRMHFVQVDWAEGERQTSLPADQAIPEQKEGKRTSNADAPASNDKPVSNQDGFHVVTSRKDGVLSLGGVKVRLQDGQVQLPQSDTLKPSEVRVLSAPTMLVRVGQEAAMTIGERVAYMVKRDDGSLVVEQSEDVAEGIVVDLFVDKVDGDLVSFKKLSVRISKVVGRQEIPGVPFDVGRPMIRSTAISSAFRLIVGHTVAIAVPKTTADAPMIYLLLSVELPQ